MATFRDLLAAAKSEIREIDPEGAAAQIEAGALVLDVREPDEYEEGALLGAIHIPRGHLEAQIENRIADKSAPIVVYCAGGVRSAFAAKTLAELGYTDVESMAGGFGRWKDEGRPWKQPASLTPEQNNRYKRHLLLPEVGVEGQVKLLEAKVLMLGAGGLGSPAALYLAAAGVGTIGIVDMDEVDSSNLQRQILHNIDRIGDRKVDSAKKTLTMLNPDVDVVTYDTRLDASNIIDIISGYDVIVDGADNFPSRYLLNDASVKLGIPVVHGSIFRFEGMVSVFHPTQGPTYRDMVPRATAGRTRPELRRGRRARRAARHHRLDPGARDDQGDPRPRRSADRANPHRRHQRHGVPGVQPQGRPCQRGHLRQPRPHRDQGTRRPLRTGPGHVTDQLVPASAVGSVRTSASSGASSSRS